MIKGIGIDIEEIGRFRKLPYNRNRSFYDKIFTSKEMTYCLGKKDPYPHFAARFAAKEAVAKAIGVSVYRAKSIEIGNNRDGVPSAQVRGLRGRIAISISHTKGIAAAIAIWSN